MSTVFLTPRQCSSPHDIDCTPPACGSSVGQPLHTSSPSVKMCRQQVGTTKRNSTHGKKLKIINTNCQSISAKRDRFLAELDLSKPDIVVRTESWLDPDIASGEVFPPNYQVFRRDRPDGVHGGVFIAVIDSLVASEVNSIQPDCENIAISISAKGIKPLYVGAFYRPPTTDEVYIGKLGQAIEMIPPNANLFLLGDFNIPDVD